MWKMNIKIKSIIQKVSLTQNIQIQQLEISNWPQSNMSMLAARSWYQCPTRATCLKEGEGKHSLPNFSPNINSMRAGLFSLLEPLGIQQCLNWGNSINKCWMNKWISSPAFSGIPHGLLSLLRRLHLFHIFQRSLQIPDPSPKPLVFLLAAEPGLKETKNIFTGYMRISRWEMETQKTLRNKIKRKKENIW